MIPVNYHFQILRCRHFLLTSFLLWLDFCSIAIYYVSISFLLITFVTHLISFSIVHLWAHSKHIYSTYYESGTILSALHILSHLKKILLISPFYRLENWSIERLHNMSKVTRLIKRLYLYILFFIYIIFYISLSFKPRKSDFRFPLLYVTPFLIRSTVES